MIDIDGQLFADYIRHFSFPAYYRIQDIESLTGLQALSQLSSASFGSTGLDDRGLSLVCRVSTLDNLNLQDTLISNQGLAALRQLPLLNILRLKDNPQLDNACVPILAQLQSLNELQLHETAITSEGLALLAELTNLRELLFDEFSLGDSQEPLLALSARLPECRIVVKGRGEAFQGELIGDWRESA